MCSGKPCGHEKLHSKASTPAAWQRSTDPTQASLRNSSMIEAIRMLGILVFELFELVDPNVEAAVADELDVFPADDLL